MTAMKTILGLDLGTNSIGWALINHNYEEKIGKIIDANSRIIPMSQDILGEFEKGNSVSQTAERTRYRGMRRLRERFLLRRERLNRTLNLLGFLPEHYADCLDRYGKFIDNKEVKLAYYLKDNGKYDFLFKESYNEMLSDFRKNQPQLFSIKPNGEETKIPYDWTIYYLRKKALSQKVEKEELAWILLQFNQKRGYYQLRGEDVERNDNSFEIITQQVVSVKKGEKDKKHEKYEYIAELDNGLIYRASFYSSIEHWVGEKREFIYKETTLKDGSKKISLSFLPTFDEIEQMNKVQKDKMYAKIKLKTEKEIKETNKTVGEYIYDTLLQLPNQKIKGKLVRTIERDFYKDELEKILACQVNLHPELKDDSIYKQAIELLYTSNDDYRNTIQQKGFQYLFLDDIIFYQRPLKSKKSEISDCSFESRKYKDEDNKEVIVHLKCISRSHPLFQEFRIWQWMQNLRIYEREKDVNGKFQTDVDVTVEFLKSEADYVDLFDFLNERKDVDQKALIRFLLESSGLKGKQLTTAIGKYRWNFIDDEKKTYPCNETHNQIVNRLKNVTNISADFLSLEKEVALWHILYSIKDKEEIKSALAKFADKNGLDKESFVESFKKYPLIKSEYGSYSEKAIKKLLPLMRMGKYWSEDNIHPTTKLRIEKLITGEFDETIQNRVREKAINLTEIKHFSGLPLWLVSYIVYDRHSEAGNTGRWTRIADIEKYLDDFKQHSLRNPIVEQVVTETLRVVKDIWKTYGNAEKRLFDEIHIELGREMKNNAEDRKAITENNLKNENTNLRIRTMLAEFANSKYDIAGVRPYSPYQQEALKIFEDGVINSGIEIPEDIAKISKSAQPTSNEILRYKLWLEQKYRSPYTGEIIPLGKLFTPAYQIEHIIPQAVYFDDSFSNKVICESEVNKQKGAQLGYEFIKNHGTEKITLDGGRTVTVFTKAEYEDFVKQNYSKNKGKAKKLLLEDIPDAMIERQLNDTRYISKFIKSILSYLVREEKDDDGVTSKNIISCNGAITSELKQHWGFNDVWNDLMLPRFERLNKLLGTDVYTTYNENYQKMLPTVPLELRKGFQLKRIDHRHHAMDALVIALTTRNHVNYLNNQTALGKKKSKDDKLKDRQDLKHLLCYKTKPDANGNYKWQFHKPWETITQDVRNVLETSIVSFKQNLRVINNTVNYHQKYKDGKKQFIKQEKGDNWAIRKSLHKETVFGKVNLLQIKERKLSAILKDNTINSIVDKNLKTKIKQLKNSGMDAKQIMLFFNENQKQWANVDFNKISAYYYTDETNDNYFATRKSLDTSFDAKKIETSITDRGIQKILLNYLQYKGGNPELAFSPEGIEELNKNITSYNDGKMHKPIIKVRVYEKGSRFAVGFTGNKKDKYVEGAKGTNLFFAIYTNDKGERSYATIPLNEVIERQKQGLPSCPATDESGNRLLFDLSPNDLVYIPTPEEQENPQAVDFEKLSKEQVGRIYKVVSFTGNRLYVIPVNISKTIVDKIEYTQLNKIEFTDDRVSAKEVCLKLNINRLGGIGTLTNKSIREKFDKFK